MARPIPKTRDEDWVINNLLGISNKEIAHLLAARGAPLVRDWALRMRGGTPIAKIASESGDQDDADLYSDLALTLKGAMQGRKAGETKTFEPEDLVRMYHLALREDSSLEWTSAACVRYWRAYWTHAREILPKRVEMRISRHFEKVKHLFRT